MRMLMRTTLVPLFAAGRFLKLQLVRQLLWARREDIRQLRECAEKGLRATLERSVQSGCELWHLQSADDPKEVERVWLRFERGCEQARAEHYVGPRKGRWRARTAGGGGGGSGGGATEREPEDHKGRTATVEYALRPTVRTIRAVRGMPLARLMRRTEYGKGGARSITYTYPSTSCSTSRYVTVGESWSCHHLI